MSSKFENHLKHIGYAKTKISYYADRGDSEGVAYWREEYDRLMTNYRAAVIASEAPTCEEDPVAALIRECFGETC